VEWITVDGVGTRKVEDTTDYIAWNQAGNVWYFGEDITEYLYDVDWNLISTSKEGSWLGGVDGAQPGILMLVKERASRCGRRCQPQQPTYEPTTTFV